MVCYCCILTKYAVLDCADFALAAYPSVSEVKFNLCDYLVKIKQCHEFKNNISSVIT